MSFDQLVILSNYKIIVLFEGQGVKENGIWKVAQTGEQIGANLMVVNVRSSLNKF
jgi:hypothetical protein